MIKVSGWVIAGFGIMLSFRSCYVFMFVDFEDYKARNQVVRYICIYGSVESVSFLVSGTSS